MYFPPEAQDIGEMMLHDIQVCVCVVCVCLCVCVWCAEKVLQDTQVASSLARPSTIAAVCVST